MPPKPRSSADREIIAQGSGGNRSGDLAAGETAGERRRESFESTRANPPSHKGKESVPFLGENEDDISIKTEHSEKDVASTRQWWKFAQNNARDCSQQTVLRWNKSDFKCHRDNFLQGVTDWCIYRNDIMASLQSIGYIPGMKLLPLDKLRMGSMIRRTVTAGPRSIIHDLNDGELMMERLENSYRQAGVIQAESFFKILYELRYDGGDPLIFTTNFWRAVRDLRSTGEEISDGIVIMFFKIAVQQKAIRWHYEVSQSARNRSCNVEDIRSDFVSSNCLRRDLMQRQDQKMGQPFSSGPSRIRGLAHVAELHHRDQSNRTFSKNKGRPKSSNRTGPNNTKKDITCWVYEQ
ncbi:hypothetical protein GcM1_173020 [Golovinomyces cichoracearum]|uniref:Uncharacterized protein n=1 Tax=Golovinomyces cichoracearum TaxID=62708 RepID=A0A420J666_9PEZI|nr:hypothetical protein GcM1_173020 [Golovinomyces cichoracearum]